MEPSTSKPGQADEHQLSKHQGNRTVVSSPENNISLVTSPPEWVQVFKLVLILSLSIALVFVGLFYKDWRLTVSDAFGFWFVAAVGVFFCWWMTKQKDQAQKAGARWVTDEQKANEGPEAPETILQMACGLEYIGEYLTSTVTLAPVAIFALLLEAAGRNDDLNTGAFVCIGAIMTWFWLQFIERMGRVRVTLPIPILKIPLLWAIPPMFILGIFWMFGWL